jgi:hypothetical protein
MAYLDRFTRPRLIDFTRQYASAWLQRSRARRVELDGLDGGWRAQELVRVIARYE